MTRSLNIESGSYSQGGGSSFGATVRKAFEEMMLTCQHGAEIKGINKFEIGENPHKTTVRPPWTPPNSPKIQKEKIAVDGRTLGHEPPGFNGRR
jgi:hypothetical protein